MVFTFAFNSFDASPLSSAAGVLVRLLSSVISSSFSSFMMRDLFRKFLMGRVSLMSADRWKRVGDEINEVSG